MQIIKIKLGNDVHNNVTFSYACEFNNKVF